MERCSESSKGLEWESLGLCSEKSDEIPERYGPFISPSGCNFGLFSNEYGICSFSKNPVSQSIESAAVDSADNYWKFSSLPLYRSRKVNGPVSDYSGSSIFCSEPMDVGLNLGRGKEFGDNLSSISNTSSVSSIPLSVATSKRSRTYFQNLQNACCQVDGCNLDLTSAKDYHRRHRICESHSKSPSVIVSGVERRFCQQCSRLHALSEFDDKKRSCRRRLSDHNARRRRLPQEYTQPGSARVPSSALYERMPNNVLLDGLPIPISNQTWENNSISTVGKSFIRPSKVDGLEGTLFFPGREIHDSIMDLRIDQGRLCGIQILSPQNLDQCLHVPPTNPSAAPDLPSVHSLLSSNPTWSSNGAMPVASLSSENYNPERQLDPHHWAAPAQSSDVISTEQCRIQVSDPGTPRLQEFQLLRADYESGCYYSDQRDM